MTLDRKVAGEALRHLRDAVKCVELLKTPRRDSLIQALSTLAFELREDCRRAAIIPWTEVE